MRILKILAFVLSVLAIHLGYAEEEKSSLPVTPIQELKIEEMKFENLPKESVVGNLAEHVKEESSLIDSLSDRLRTCAYLYPYAEGLVYVNGVLCHIGNYPRSIVYTVLEGPQYGLQTVQAYNGVILYVNYDYVLEYTSVGVVLHHYYSDSEIITGSTQVISFY